MLRLAVAFLVIDLTLSHLCLINPHQRGEMDDINEPGTIDCQLVTGPCGKRPAANPHVAFYGGEAYNFTFQKNLDHFNPKNPGYFTISIGKAMNDTIEDAILLKQVPDTKDPSLTLYTTEVALPTMTTADVVLQVIYTTNNVTAPADFYQCADIELRQPTY